MDTDYIVEIRRGLAELTFRIEQLEQAAETLDPAQLVDQDRYDSLGELYKNEVLQHKAVLEALCNLRAGVLEQRHRISESWENRGVVPDPQWLIGWLDRLVESSR